MVSKRIDIVKIKMVKESSVKYENRRIKNPWDAYKIFNDYIDDSNKEMFVLMCLNNKTEPTHISTISIGSVNESIVNPAEVFKVALLSNANRIIVCHNHPSGDPKPSEADRRITERLHNAGEIIGIKLLDHFVIGDGVYYSFKENGEEPFRME